MLRLKKETASPESCKWPCGVRPRGHKGGLTETKIMGSKTRFSTPIDRIKANHSGWSGVDCETCGKETTKAQFSYSKRFYKRPLCRTCQRLEYYRENENINSNVILKHDGGGDKVTRLLLPARQS